MSSLVMQRLAHRNSCNVLAYKSLLVRVVRLPAVTCIAKTQPRKRQRPKPFVRRKPGREKLPTNLSFGDDGVSILMGLAMEARAPKVVQLDDDFQLPDDALGSPSSDGVFAVKSHEAIRNALAPARGPSPSEGTRRHAASFSIDSSSAITSTSEVPVGADLIR